MGVNTSREARRRAAERRSLGRVRGEGGGERKLCCVLLIEVLLRMVISKSGGTPYRKTLRTFIQRRRPAKVAPSGTPMGGHSDSVSEP
jgi:hypothetical protein